MVFGFMLDIGIIYLQSCHLGCHIFLNRNTKVLIRNGNRGVKWISIKLCKYYSDHRNMGMQKYDNCHKKLRHETLTESSIKTLSVLRWKQTFQR